MIYSLAGIMQVGLGAAAVAASPLLYNDNPQRIVQLDDGHHDDGQQEYNKQLREENERHEREMQRRDHESDRDYNERQRKENERHENVLRDLEIILTGIRIGSDYQNW